jgi:hypothetical protein
MEAKRQVPPVLKKLLAWDADVTKKFVSFLLNFVQVRSFARHCKLEAAGMQIPSILMSICF